MALTFCFCVGMTLFSGCTFFYDENNPQPQNSSIAALQVCFDDQNYQLDNTFNQYSKHILQQLALVFGTASGSTASAPTTVVQNYDKIRVQYGQGTVLQNTGFLWTFAKNFADCQTQENPNDVLSYYTQAKKQAYVQEYVNIYASALEVVAMQIAMNQTPSTFFVDINETTGQTKVFATSAKTQQINDAFVQSFDFDGKYVGFTPANLQTFKSYIQTHVIGQTLLGSQFDVVATTNGTKTISALLDEILALDDGLEKNFQTPYPALSVTTQQSLFYPSKTSSNLLGHIEAKDYKSITLIPNKTVTLSMLTFAFEAETNVRLSVSVVYHSVANGTSSYSTGEVNISPGRYQNKDLQMLSLQSPVTLSAFASLMPQNQILPISNATGTAKFFDYTPNGASLRADAVNCDFLTITFSQETYIPFKWAIVTMI